MYMKFKKQYMHNTLSYSKQKYCFSLPDSMMKCLKNQLMRTGFSSFSTYSKTIQNCHQSWPRYTISLTL